MPFPHIVKVLNTLIQKLRNVIDKLLDENRKLADENCQLNIQILDLSNKLFRESEKHSKATAIIRDLKWRLEGCYWKIEDLESLLEERKWLIYNQADEIAYNEELVHKYRSMLQKRICDF